MRLFVGVIVALVLAAVGMAQAPPTLTEVQRLQAELHRTKAQILELSVQLASCQSQQQAVVLREERQRLEAAFREALKPEASATFDWRTLTFVSQAADGKP